MRILISNDDGINAPGLLALCSSLASVGEMTIVSTNEEKSGYAHAITLEKPLRAQPMLLDGRFPAHVLNGTPADCVKYGLRIMESPPDIVVSGINLGANSGLNIHYSGTVAAAKEGAMNGILSVAVSLRGRKPFFDNAIFLAARIVPWLVERFGNRKPAPLFNLNVPVIQELRGVKLVRQSEGRFVDQFQERIDPRGRTYYWLNGDDTIKDAGQDHDDWALDAGWASLTPLALDWTDRALLTEMGGGSEISF